MSGSGEYLSFDDFCSIASINSTTDYFWVLYRPNYGIATGLILLFYLLIGVPSNFLVGAIMLWKKLHKQPTHILLLNLILCDIVLLLTIMPQGMVTGFAGEFIFGGSDHTRCQFCHTGVIFTWFSIMSLCTIALMSVDRFLFIYRPLHYEKSFTPLKTIIILIFVWVFCTVIAILPVLGFGEIVFFHIFASCTVDFSASNNYYLGLLLVTALIPLIVLIICNAFVIRIVLKNIKIIYKVRKSLLSVRRKRSHTVQLRRVVRKKKQVHLMRVFGSLFVASLSAWIPTIIVTFLSFVLPFGSIPPAFNLLAYFLLLSQVVLHPILEAVLITAIKEPIMNFINKIQKKFKCCLRVSSENYSTDKKEESQDRKCCTCDALYIFYAALIPRETESENSDVPVSRTVMDSECN